MKKKKFRNFEKMAFVKIREQSMKLDEENFFRKMK